MNQAISPSRELVLSASAVLVKPVAIDALADISTILACLGPSSHLTALRVEALP
ncbi:MAG TPA: hypothetical protein VMZ51_05160 [Acidimicrobiales bacterium]|nr:hypothetical protein [Acidimicrobiales bacterium]